MGEMTMVERVARAIYEKCNGAGCRAWGSLPKSHQEPYLSDARAAIGEMREPTPAVLYQGEGYADFIMPGGFENTRERRQAELRVAYQVMIDAALSEERKP